MTEENDSKLIRACLAGDQAAYEVLIDRYQKAIYNTALKMVRDRDEAKDITQEVFVRAYENLKEYNPDYKFFSWIYKMTLNQSINVINRRKRQTTIESSMISNHSGPEAEFEQKQLDTRIQDAIAGLSIEHRMVIILRHFADLSYRELSFVLEIPEKTVKSRLFDARQRLAQILSKYGIAEYGL